MAKNIIHDPGYNLSVVVSDPATPASGDPVRFGSLTGIALTDEGDGGNAATETTVNFGPFVADIPVVGEASAINPGDALFYDDAIDGVNNDAVNGYFFGFALEAVGNGLTDTILVFHSPSPGAGTLADGAITAGKLANNALSADATGRAKMQDGYFDVATALAKFAANSIANAFLLDAVADGAFQNDAATRALFADAIWTGAKLAVGILSADATGRGLVAENWLDTATALLAFNTDSIANAWLIKAIADGSFQADAATRALFADGVWTEAKLAAASLTGLVAKVVADANVIGGLTVLHRIDVGDATANTDVVLTHKTRVIDAWGVNTGIAAHAANDTWQVKNGANAISDAVAKTATVNAVKRVGTIDPAQAEIAAGGTLRVAAVKDTNAAVTVYVLGIRVA